MSEDLFNTISAIMDALYKMNENLERIADALEAKNNESKA